MNSTCLIRDNLNTFDLYLYLDNFGTIILYFYLGKFDISIFLYSPVKRFMILDQIVFYSFYKNPKCFMQ